MYLHKQLRRAAGIETRVWIILSSQTCIGDNVDIFEKVFPCSLGDTIVSNGIVQPIHFEDCLLPPRDDTSPGKQRIMRIDSYRVIPVMTQRVCRFGK